MLGSFQQPPQPPRIRFFCADRTLTFGAVPVILKWRVENADETRIVPDVGSVPPVGTAEVNPRQEMKYTLIAQNRHGAESRSLTIKYRRLPEVGFTSVLKFKLHPPKPLHHFRIAKLKVNMPIDFRRKPPFRVTQLNHNLLVKPDSALKEIIPQFQFRRRLIDHKFFAPFRKLFQR